MGFIVAIDGPAGAGKSTVARMLARELGFALVDTGAIYRSVALLADRRGIAFEDEPGLEATARSARIDFHFEGTVNHVRLDDEDVTEAIRRPEMSRAASRVSSRPAVRAALLDLQRRLALDAPHGAVLEGRDIGTVVFPEAPVKIFLTASPETRARRRHDELKAKGSDLTFEQVLADQIARDREDENRAVAPLKPAADAVRCDTTGKGTDAVVVELAELVRSRLPR